MNEGQDHANLPYFGNAGRRAPKEVAGNLFDMLVSKQHGCSMSSGGNDGDPL